MSAMESASHSSAKRAASPEKTLRRLFLTLFLRGRSSRGLQKSGAPTSIRSKLALSLVFYASFGLFSLAFIGQPVFTLSIYLHAMSLVFLGMFVASSAGEVLFNDQEADILMHRPIEAKSLLWAKIAVLIQVSIWLAGAFNVAGTLAGIVCKDGGRLFPIAHAAPTVMEALFCTGGVVLMYQLCLRWFGRERLNGLMTMTQVVVAIAAVLGGQLAPQFLGRLHGELRVDFNSWWIGALPPAWFAGFDDALAGSGAANSWVLAAIGLTVTATVLWLSFGKLARDYQSGLQSLNESAPASKSRVARRRWINKLVKIPPLKWWLRDSVSRASFLLTVAYLARDRDVKLRVYPGTAPMLMLPVIMLFQSHRRAGAGDMGGFGLALSGVYLALIPTLAMRMLQYSQQWQAADIFRIAPIAGPAPLGHGVRRAVLLFFTMPLLVLLGIAAWLLESDHLRLLLLLPGVIATPVFALLPCLDGKLSPLSTPTEEAKSASRGLNMVGIMVLAMVLAGLSSAAWSMGWFKSFITIEAAVSIASYIILRTRIDRLRWQPMED